MLCFQCNGGIRLLDREQYLKNENTIIKIIKKAKGNIKVKNKDRPLNSKAREETCFAMWWTVLFVCEKNIFALNLYLFCINNVILGHNTKNNEKEGREKDEEERRREKKNKAKRKNSGNIKKRKPWIQRVSVKF